jgi:hypothetical protein
MKKNNIKIEKKRHGVDEIIRNYIVKSNKQ